MAPPHRLTDAIVTAFMSAPKRVDTPSAMVWRKLGDHARRWRAVIEVDTELRAGLSLYYNLAVPMFWNFNLELHGYTVYGWHLKPGSRHKNWKACGPDFPTGRVRTPHEQVWVEAVGKNKCARPLDGLDEATHKDIFDAFCQRVSLACSVIHREPEEGEQLTFAGETDT